MVLFMSSWERGLGPQRLFLGLRNQGFLEEALVQLLDYIMDNVMTFWGSILGGAMRTLGFGHTVKNCGNCCGFSSWRNHSWGAWHALALVKAF